MIPSTFKLQWERTRFLLCLCCHIQFFFFSFSWGGFGGEGFRTEQINPGIIQGWERWK